MRWSIKKVVFVLQDYRHLTYGVEEIYGMNKKKTKRNEMKGTIKESQLDVA